MNWNEIKGKKEKWLIPFLFGLLLLVIAIPTSGKKEGQEGEEAYVEKQETRHSYIREMEYELEQVLSKVKGVGKVSVMITISSSSEKIVEKDEETSVQKNTENGSENTATDRRETSVYTGASGEDIPYVVKEISPQIAGVVVVAEGGDNAVVIESITSAVQALFGIETHKIKVMKHY